MNIKRIFDSRPFKVLNADEYDSDKVLSLFEGSVEGLIKSYEFENVIVRGRSGAGKTMFLRANQVYYFDKLFVSVSSGEEVILPIFISMNRIKKIKSSEGIYGEFVKMIVGEFTGIYRHYADACKYVRRFEKAEDVAWKGVYACSTFMNWSSNKQSVVNDYLEKITYNEKIEERSSKREASVGLGLAPIRISGGNDNNVSVKLKTGPSIDFSLVDKCYHDIFGGENCKILLLIDEVSSLDVSFFRRDENGVSDFEYLLNQIRTVDYLRVKISINTDSYADIIRDEKYGYAVNLDYSVIDSTRYLEFRKHVLNIVKKYLIVCSGDAECDIAKFIDISFFSDYGDSLEQIILASSGNVRKLINILDASMVMAHKNHSSDYVVYLNDACEAIKKKASDLEDSLSPTLRSLLQKIVNACKCRNNFMFAALSISGDINDQIKILIESGLIYINNCRTLGGKNIYVFDYGYCLLKELPTHFLRNSTEINNSRSLGDGDWIQEVVDIAHNVVLIEDLRVTLYGSVYQLYDWGGSVVSVDGKKYSFNFKEIEIIGELKLNKKVRFILVTIELLSRIDSIEVL